MINNKIISKSYKKRLCELAGITSYKSHLQPEELNQIMKGYIEAALWTEEERLKDDYASETGISSDNDQDDEGTEFDKLIGLTNNFKHKSFESFTKENIESDSLIQAYVDIKKFLELAGNSIVEAIEINGLERLGHDIWLTRNHHGAGFFDHSYEHENEQNLMYAAHTLKEVSLYVNDNLMLTFSNAH